MAIASFELNSGQAFAGVINPIIKFPALILLVQVSLWLKKKYYGKEQVLFNKGVIVIQLRLFQYLYQTFLR